MIHPATLRAVLIAQRRPSLAREWAAAVRDLSPHAWVALLIAACGLVALASCGCDVMM